MLAYLPLTLLGIWSISLDSFIFLEWILSIFKSILCEQVDRSSVRRSPRGLYPVSLPIFWNEFNLSLLVVCCFYLIVVHDVCWSLEMNVSALKNPSMIFCACACTYGYSLCGFMPASCPGLLTLQRLSYIMVLIGIQRSLSRSSFLLFLSMISDCVFPVFRLYRFHNFT